MWFCVLVNVVMLLGMLFFFTPKVEREAEEAGSVGSEQSGDQESGAMEEKGSWLSGVAAWLKTGPLSNARFMFFILMAENDGCRDLPYGLASINGAGYI